MRKPIIAGNWKMNNTKTEAIALVSALKNKVADILDVEIVVCPTFVSLDAVANVIKGSNIGLGAQNVYFETKGAFTGELSPAMLKDVGCQYVILGHSERRALLKETNEDINKKIKLVLSEGLTPIVCVGETLEQREAGDMEKVVRDHVVGSLKDLSAEDMKKCVIAYEPVWAIGTGKTATPEQAEEVHAFIRNLLKEIFDDTVSSSVRIQYGGSVKPSNAKELMSKENIDGALVGGASLDVDSFYGIINYKA